MTGPQIHSSHNAVDKGFTLRKQECMCVDIWAHGGHILVISGGIEGL